MGKAVASGVAAGLLAVSLLVAADDGPVPVQASHGNLNVHVHDDFYHPAGAFVVGPGTDHTLAEAACETANPFAACDAVIHEGDTITWVAPAPLAVNLHSVTECTGNTFSICGPAVSAANPIGDSGVRNPPPDVGSDAWPYGPVQFNSAGTYYYRCEIHPSVMRGRIVVLGGVGGAVELPVLDGDVALEQSDSRGSGAPLALALAAVAVAALAAGGLYAWRSRRGEG